MPAPWSTIRRSFLPTSPLATWTPKPGRPLSHEKYHNYSGSVVFDGPLKPSVDKLKGIFAGYGEKIASHWHNFESQDGKKFMESKALDQAALRN